MPVPSPATLWGAWRLAPGAGGTIEEKKCIENWEGEERSTEHSHGSSAGNPALPVIGAPAMLPRAYQEFAAEMSSHSREGAWWRRASKSRERMDSSLVFSIKQNCFRVAVGVNPGEAAGLLQREAEPGLGLV